MFFGKKFQQKNNIFRPVNFSLQKYTTPKNRETTCTDTIFISLLFHLWPNCDRPISQQVLCKYKLFYFYTMDEILMWKQMSKSINKNKMSINWNIFVIWNFLSESCTLAERESAINSLQFFKGKIGTKFEISDIIERIW